ncbi:helix-turn-helix transcriptional regulator [Schlegelella sp. S2-27]|uniref:Helix-turn-helix transcriptional regulator n=1 Tax=Caldimonas mangrovi TaxID=2944811 RepID=A0ABT0YMR5_9BURK|nr:substrate-binding domain-containing protein [Caldimonas mangrovi]MCM5679547.1 helix-turn-helix transcriptional regulator [Caldimonas mangrovi]
MHRIQLTYSLGPENAAAGDLQHPLLHLLEAIHRSGSISAAAREVHLSYRHVWGELKRWEQELGQPLVLWAKGQRAQLAPFGEKLLWAERRARARLAPQVEALRSELERAFAVAFDADAGVLTVYASHDAALPKLREMAASQHNLHLDIQFTGSVDALAALNEGRCLMAGFHALVESPLRSPTARVYRPMFKPGMHKLIGFAERAQGLIVAAGNPLGLQTLADLARPGLRFANRPRGTGTRVVLEQLLASQRLVPSALATWERAEPSHEAAAEAVASGSADASFGIEPAARRRGLEFIELAREQYFLATLRSHLEQPEVLKLRALLRSQAWQQVLAALPGYAPARSGEVLSLRQVLPWWSWRKPKG